ncbi:MAG: hypothetical protein ACAI35_19585 [Candidatus Methylacidiphilales bacterium]|nr:hypothetical protein [Candidatus Methylacidiphilales bacterium]
MAPALSARADWIWVEGEKPVSQQVVRHPWYSDVKRDQLSGGDFVAHFDKGREGEAAYEFDAPKGGDYDLWVRANTTAVKLSYELNGGAATDIKVDQDRSGVVNIARDSKIDLRFVAWVRVGTMPLKAGKNRIVFRFHSDNSNHGSLDCFVFVNEPFMPNGTLKPSEMAEHAKQSAEANKGWLPWAPGRDPLKDSPIDLRYLNEAFAGEHGRILARGEVFVHEKPAASGPTSLPVRFWAVNGPPENLQGEGMNRHARMLAKYGVNLVRLHGAVMNEKTGATRMDVIRSRIAAIRSLKGEGIYSLLSIYFPLWVSPDAGPGWREGYNGSTHPFAAMYFNKDLQAQYREWWKAVLTTPGADGSTLLNEPALMALELVNEDSLFFWTFNSDRIPDPQMRIVEKQFGDWATKKYGSISAAMSTWKNVPHKRDAALEGRLGFRPLYSMFTEKTQRDQDTAAFLLETQSNFYRETTDYLRSLGYKGMITASNWTTASNDVFGPLEKLSYMSGDFIDRHGYFSCNHKGDNSAWSIRDGHTYSDVSALRFESEKPGDPKRFSHPSMDPMYNGKPSMISETAWNRPNRYRSEAPLYFAAYGALQDTDSIVHFVMDSDNWSVKPRFFMQPWTLLTPTQAGQFPAAAAIYRRGLIKPGEMMAELPMKISDAVALKGSSLVQTSNLDELRKADVSKAEVAEAPAGIDPLIHLVGRCNVSITNAGGKATLKELKPYINRTSQTIVSSTGELMLDYGKGILRLNAPSAQGCSGNLKAAGSTDLKDVVITSDMDLVNIVLVALDEKPLAVSSRILLQAMTEEKATGFATEPAGNGVMRITSIGQDPWLFREIRGSVKLKRADAAQLKITALNLEGYPAGNASALAAGGAIELKPGTVYYLIQK